MMQNFRVSLVVFVVGGGWWFWKTGRLTLVQKSAAIWGRKSTYLSCDFVLNLFARVSKLDTF